MANIPSKDCKLFLMEGHLHPSGLLSAVTVLLENLVLKSPNERFLVNLGPGSLYYDRKFGENAWEYYFTQPKFDFGRDCVIEDEWSVEKGFLFKWQGFLDPSNRSGSYDKTLLDSAKLFGTVFSFNDDLLDYLEEKRSEILPSGPVLAVHRRETDYYPNVPEIEAFFEKVDPFVEDGFKIYLATDSKKALSQFRKRYGKRVLFQKATRSSSLNPIHTSKKLLKSPALIGREVLVDAYLMAKCWHLIRTRSNVTTFTRILNPNLPWSELLV